MERKRHAKRLAKRQSASDADRHAIRSDKAASAGLRRLSTVPLWLVPWISSKGVSMCRTLWKFILAYLRVGHGRVPEACKSKEKAKVECPVSIDMLGKNTSASDQLIRIFFRRRDKEVAIDAAVENEFGAYLQTYRNREGQRELVLLRGPPGIGKSTHALKLLGETSTAAKLVHVCSTDDFFTRIYADGREVYCFNAKKLGQNHGRNQERVRLVASLGLTPIFVDNTNMTRQEMRSYIKIANKAQYNIRIIEPQEIHPQWNDLEFLQERNQHRTPPGKVISKSVLKGMLERFEPTQDQAISACSDCRKQKPKRRNNHEKSTDARARHASLALPEYMGINLDKELGGASGLGKGLWRTLAKALVHDVQSLPLDLSRCTVPNPLHVTTFHRNDLKGRHTQDIVLESMAAEGNMVNVTIEAVALIVDGLACAVVTNLDPPVLAPHNKVPHVTLAVRAPWRPVQSNDLLHAMMGGSDIKMAARQEGLDCGYFPHLDLSRHWQNGPVRIFEHILVCGRDCRALLIRLPEPLVISGPRFRYQ